MLKSQSFIGQIVKNMNVKAEEMKRQSMVHAKALEFGEPVRDTNFSLVLC